MPSLESGEAAGEGRLCRVSGRFAEGSELGIEVPRVGLQDLWDRRFTGRCPLQGVDCTVSIVLGPRAPAPGGAGRAPTF